MIHSQATEEKSTNQKPEEVIRNLNEIDELYCNSPDPRTQALRSGENVYLTAMLLSKIIYKIREKTNGMVELSATFRVKAQGSQDAKIKSKGNTNIKDIMAYTIVIDRMHNSSDFESIFYDKPELLKRYHERILNIRILEIAIDYIESLIENRDFSRDDLNSIKNQCQIIKSNINRYEQDSDEINKCKLNQLSVEQVILDMCIEYEQDEEFNKWCKKIVEGLGRKQKPGNIKKAKKEEKSDEEKFCELNLLILFCLMKLQFEPNGEFKGNQIIELKSQLKTAVELYYQQNIQGEPYSNLQYRDIIRLLNYVEALNDSLSDKLEWEFMDILKDYGILRMTQIVWGEKEALKKQEKKKTNGYVAQHYDGKNGEAKLITGYRNQVQNYGSAAHGGYATQRKITAIKELKKPKIFSSKLALKKRCSVHEIFYNFPYKQIVYNNIRKVSGHNNKEKLNYIIRNAIKKWREESFKKIPRYFEIKYDNGNIQFKICSEAENITTLFNQIDSASAQKAVRKRVKSFVNGRFISDTSETIIITQEQCKEFFADSQGQPQNINWKDLRAIIDKGLQPAKNKRCGGDTEPEL